ncbi:hypothetical protein ACFL2K_00060 [Candidatus Margulisiibacteriota bacterium]
MHYLKTIKFIFIIVTIFVFLNGCIPEQEKEGAKSKKLGPSTPRLIIPKNNATLNPDDNLFFDWTDVKRAQNYELVIYNLTTNKILIRINEIASSNYIVSLESTDLKDNEYQNWLWTVRAKTNNYWRSWAPYRKFHIKK